MTRRLVRSLVVFSLLSASACAGRVRPEPLESPLALDTVVLYRSGVGYFERRGEVDGDVLKIRVRKDQVNDLLKSLTVVDSRGRALSISMPLDPQSWVETAMATLSPGEGSLAQILDSLRGTAVSVVAKERRLSGRIVMVEELINEPATPPERGERALAQIAAHETRDYRLTLLDDQKFRVVRLSEIESVALADGDLAMQLHRSLDASAGEGMFQQVDIEIRLTDAKAHDLTVSYVVSAPMWKPTYRVVLGEPGKKTGLLQAWAVVDNVSGEDWNDVSLSLTSGAPIAFRYDLHTPRSVERVDLTESSVHRQAAAALAETTFDAEAAMEEAAADDGGDMAFDESERADEMDADMAQASGALGRAESKPMAKSKRGRGAAPSAAGAAPPPALPEPASPKLDVESMQRSMSAETRTRQVSGLVRVDLEEKVTIPDGTSTMVALLNKEVEAEETFLFKPGGAGVGYELNPYRVVRFRNDTGHVLEPGPISIFARGSFVGEGLSEAVGTRTSVTIPFAVEPEIRVSSSVERSGDEAHITRISRGVVEVESFRQAATTWRVQLPPRKEVVSVLVRHERAGDNYELVIRPEGTEDLAGAYLIPVEVPAGKKEAAVRVMEQTPSHMSLSIWDSEVIHLLDQLLSVSQLDAQSRGKLDQIVAKRREIGRIDTEIAGLEKQQRELDERLEQTRRNLDAIKKDARAGQLRARLSRRLEEFANEADALGRRIVELSSQRLEHKIELEDLLENFEFKAPAKK